MSEENIKRKKTYFNPGRLVFGLLIIVVGFLLLAQSIGLITFDLGVELWRFWPILIIIAGLSMLEFHSWWANILSLIVALAVIAGLIFMIFMQGDGGSRKLQLWKATGIKCERVESVNQDI